MNVLVEVQSFFCEGQISVVFLRCRPTASAGLSQPKLFHKSCNSDFLALFVIVASTDWIACAEARCECNVNQRLNRSVTLARTAQAGYLMPEKGRCTASHIKSRLGCAKKRTISHYFPQRLPFLLETQATDVRSLPLTGGFCNHQRWSTRLYIYSTKHYRNPDQSKLTSQHV